VPDSQSASERGGSATARKAPANKAGVIWWSTDAEKRKRRRKSRRLGRLLSGTRLWSGGEKPAGFSRILRRELSGEGKQNSAGCLSVGARACRLPVWSSELVVHPRSRPLYLLKGRLPEPECHDSRRVQGVRFFESVRLLGGGE